MPSKIAHMEQMSSKSISVLTPSLDLCSPNCPISVEWMLSLNDKTIMLVFIYIVF